MRKRIVQNTAYIIEQYTKVNWTAQYRTKMTLLERKLSKPLTKDLYKKNKC